MDKKYLAQIIATDNEGLQMISACTAGAKVKVVDIKYLASNKVFYYLLNGLKLKQTKRIKKSIVYAGLILLIKLSLKTLIKKTTN